MATTPFNDVADLQSFQDRQNANRQSNLASIDAWQQSRTPYYSAMYDQMNKSAEGGIEQSYADSMKRMQLQHAARGTDNSSQQVYNQGQLGAAKALQTAQARQRSQDYVQGVRREDLGQAHQLRMQQYEMTPYEQQYYQSLMSRYGYSDKMYQGMASVQAQKLQDQAAYQQAMSQIYGQAIGMGMQGATMLAMNPPTSGAKP